MGRTSASTSPPAKRPRSGSPGVDAAAATPPPPATSAGSGGSGVAAHPLQGRYAALMEDETLADCAVVVQDVEYKCIRGILAQESGFFKARFFGADKPTPDDGRVVVDGVTTPAWKAVRLWLYTASKTPVTTVDEVKDLLQAAERLDVPALTTQTVADAADLLSTSTAVALSNLSWSGPPGLEPLQAASFEFLRAHFDALRGDAELLSTLTTPVFRTLVACPTLVVRSENALLRVVWRRLATAADHSRDDVEALLGGIRLRLLHASSLSTLSRVARGETTSALPAPAPAVQAGAAAVALRGLPMLAAVGVDDGAPLEARRVARNSEPGTSACVVYRLDQTHKELSPVFLAGGHKWQLEVQLHGGSGLGLNAFVGLLSRPVSESTVDATVTIWAHAVDGGRRVRLTMGQGEVKLLEPQPVVAFNFTHTFKVRSNRGSSSLLSSSQIERWRGSGRDVSLIVGATVWLP